MKRIIAVLAGLATVVLVSLTVASPAAAADPHFAQGTWQLRDWDRALSNRRDVPGVAVHRHVRDGDVEKARHTG